MPQLNASNWFMMFIITWLTMLATTTKIVNTNFTNQPNTKHTKTDTTSWTWPW